MRQTRRQFIQQSLLALPAVGALTSCGGGGANAASSSQSSTSAGYAPPQNNFDLSTGLKAYGTAPVSYSPLAKQPVGVRFKDPDFGTTMVRITDIASGLSGGQNKASVAAPAYPTAQAWNCDESRFILYVTTYNYQSGNTQGWAMFDGKTYAFIKFLPINPADIEQFYWDHTQPSTLYYIDNRTDGSSVIMRMVAMNVETEVVTVIHDFLPDITKLGWPASGPVRCGYPYALGRNAQGQQIWGLGAGGIPNIGGQLALNVFGYNQATGAFIFYNQSQVPLAQARGTTPFALLSGNGWGWPDPTGAQTPTAVTGVIGPNGTLLRSVGFDASEHVSTAQNARGEDLMVGAQYSRNTGGNGNLIVANLQTGAVTTLVGEANGYGYPRTGALTGATAYMNAGWAVCGITGNPYGNGSASSRPTNTATVLDQEIVLANADTGKVFRLCHHRSTGYYTSAPVNNYWAQTNVTLSPSGTRILVQSDWGNADPYNPVVNPGAAVDTYVIELPTYTG